MGCIGIQAKAQVSLDAQVHRFKPGDSHRFVFTSPAEEGPSGEHVVWDFSRLDVTGEMLESHMLRASETDYAPHFPSADVVLEEFGTQYYFKTSAKGMELMGIADESTLRVYEKPVSKLAFPFAYNDRIAGEFSFPSSYSGANPVTGRYEVHADAHGAILLPNQTKIDNVLRVKQTWFYGAGLQAITYRWYAAGVSYPLLVVQQHVSGGKKSTDKTAYHPYVKSRIETPADDANELGLVVYPNPVRGEFTVGYEIARSGMVVIQGIDASGKPAGTLLRENQQAGAHVRVFNAGELGLVPGAHFIRVSAAGKISTVGLVVLP